MTVDVFGRKLNTTSGVGAPGKPGVGFKTTPSGDYSLEGKRLCNVAIARGGGDVVTLDVLNHRLQHLTQHITELLDEEHKSNALTIEERVNANLLRLNTDLEVMKKKITNLIDALRLLYQIAGDSVPESHKRV